MQLVNMIVAVGHYGQIGLGGTMPWSYSENPVTKARNSLDLQIFRKVTTDGILIAGKKTYDVVKPKIDFANTNRILVQYKKEVPIEPMLEGFKHHLPNRQIWVIGGGFTYEAFAPFINGVVIKSFMKDYFGPADTYLYDDIW